ncbi:MAG: NUDIX hydrolase [Clostridia bacterium]|nr:NUDIX hydrolase [Clostridia bacterium]
MKNKQRAIRGIKKIKTNLKFYIVYNEKGRPKGIMQAKKENQQVSEEKWLKGVTCFVINENGEILMERRVNKGLTPGAFDLCSGHIDNLEIPFHAMIRELHEELGLDHREVGEKLRKVSDKPLPLRFKSGDKTRNFHISFFCTKLTAEQVKDIKKQDSEVSEVIWLPSEEVFEMIQKGETKFPKEGDYSSIFENVRAVIKPNPEKEQVIK